MEDELDALCARIVNCANATGTQMIIMQGTPGSGKTTIAKILVQKHPNAVMVSADDFFTDEKGRYAFDASKLSEAHESCKQKARAALASKKAVIVDNCNATNAQTAHYFQMIPPGAKPCVVHMKCESAQAAVTTSARSVHNVPEHAVRRCYFQMERLSGNYITHVVA